MKKIAILTRKSTHNYGTLLQCYALQKVIASMDPDVQTIDEQRLIKDYLDRKKPVRAKVSLKRKMYDRYEKIRSKYFGYQYRPQTKKLFIRFQQNHIRYDIASGIDVLLSKLFSSAKKRNARCGIIRDSQ